MISDDQLLAALRNEMQCEPGLGEAAAVRIRALIAERDEAKGWAQHYRCEAAEDAEALRAAEAEGARLIAERDQYAESAKDLRQADGRNTALIRTLTAERDEARRHRTDLLDRALAAEAEVARLRGLLREAQGALEWTMNEDVGAALNRRIDAALATEAAPVAEYPDDDALKRSLATAFPEDRTPMPMPKSGREPVDVRDIAEDRT